VIPSASWQAFSAYRFNQLVRYRVDDRQGLTRSKALDSQSCHKAGAYDPEVFTQLHSSPCCLDNNSFCGAEYANV
jgi:hypothetical protein